MTPRELRKNSAYRLARVLTDLLLISGTLGAIIGLGFAVTESEPGYSIAYALALFFGSGFWRALLHALLDRCDLALLAHDQGDTLKAIEHHLRPPNAEVKPIPTDDELKMLLASRRK